MITFEVASLQLLAKYPQLPAVLIGQSGTLIWHIGRVNRQKIEDNLMFDIFTDYDRAERVQFIAF